MSKKINNVVKTWCLKIKDSTRLIKKEIGALYIAYKRDDVPFYAKIVVIIVVGYSLSPIDLIPDFIPILGFIDDIILLPLGITLAIKLIPNDIMNECREQSKNILTSSRTKNWIAGVIIICIWIAILSNIIIRIV